MDISYAHKFGPISALMLFLSTETVLVDQLVLTDMHLKLS